MTLYDLWNRLVPAYAPDNGPSGGGNENDPPVDDENEGENDNEREDDLGENDDDDAEHEEDERPVRSPEESYKRLMDRFHGDAEAVAAFLFKQNYRTRTQLRLTRGQVKDLQKQVPRNGKYLTKNEVREFNEYRALKLSPKQVRERMSAHASLETEVATTRRESTLRDVADAETAKFAVLKQLGANLEYEVKEVDGKQRAFVRVKGADNTITLRPLREYADEHWGDFKVALFPEGEGTASQRRTFARQPAPGNTTNGNRNGVGGSETKGVAGSFVQQRYGDPKKQQTR